MPKLAPYVIVGLLASLSAGWGQTVLSDQQIIERIIQQSRQDYYATGHPCACPYDLARNGSSCGGRSAYSRPGGAEPKCYAKDVTKADMDAYRMPVKAR
jgi:hypothetical protein